MSNYREGANDRINEIMCALRCLCVYYTKSRYDISARNKDAFIRFLIVSALYMIIILTSL